MFSLVKFDNKEYCTLPSKRIKIVKGTNCIVKYHGGAKYNAQLIRKSDNINWLELILRKLKKKKKQLTSSTPIKEKINVPNEFINSTFSINSTNSASTASSNDGVALDSNLSNDFSLINTENKLSEDQIENEKNYLYRQNELCNISNVTDPDIHNLHSENDENYLNHQNELCNISNATDPDIHNSHSENDENYLNHQNELCNISNATDPDIHNSHSENDKNYLNHQIELCNISNATDPEVHNSHLEIPSVNSYDPIDKSNDDSSFRPEESTNNLKPETPTDDDLTIYDQGCAPMIQELAVLECKTTEGKSKKHMCPFCKTLQTKFARHLLLKHKGEEEVKKIIHLPNKNAERLQIINVIRKRGDFMHNTKPELNSGILIVPRQKQVKSKNTAEDYICCKSCKGFFAKRTIRFHAAKCDRKRMKGQRNILSSGRRLTGYIHPIASETLRRKIFPVLIDDDVVRSIKYDELIIMYGNKLCDRYTLQHQHDYIRTQLRMLGRFKLKIMKIENEISEFKDIFNPKYFDKCIICLRDLAEWDESSGKFKVPFNAQFVSTLLKKCAKKHRIECIKKQDNIGKVAVEDFLLLWEEEVPNLINRKAFNDQMDKRRDKKVVLPAKNDIKLLHNYLKEECLNALTLLQSTFDLNAYKLLTKCTLILVQLFNRRRAGEIERLPLISYENREVLNDNIDKTLYQKLSNSTKEFAKQFTRLTTKGKLERTVPVLLCPLALKCMEQIIKYRKHAGIPDDNEFIFCSFNTNELSKPYLRACPLLRRFSNECGAVMPRSLRGTQLRKHIATYTSMLNVEESRIDRLANFMGHHKDIHKSIYRVPVPVTEITDVSKLLMAAIGEDNDDGEASDDDEVTDGSSDEEDAGVLVSNSLNSSNENNISPQSRNQLKSSSKTKIKRTKWSQQEKEAIDKHFGNLKQLPKLPSLKECQNAIQKYKILKNRTPSHIFAYINNQRRRI